MDTGSDYNMVRSNCVPIAARRDFQPGRPINGFFGKGTTLAQLHAVIEAKDHRAVQRRTRCGIDVTHQDFGYDVLLGMPWINDANILLQGSTTAWFYELRDSDITLVRSRKEIQKAIRESSVAAVLMVSGVSGKNQDIGQCLTAGASSDPPETSIPEEYQDLKDVFDTAMASILPEHHNWDHPIELEEGKKPPFGPIYSLAEKELEVLRDYIEKALKNGWIRQSRSPAGAPVLFVPKTGGQLRLCVDYRELNKITKKDRTALPLIGEILDRLVGAKRFTKLDLKDAYYRLRIRQGDEWKTAFRTKYGHFEYLVMPFGLANAPASFQQYINNALSGLVDTICIVYLDDILIYSSDPTKHTQHVRSVLQRLREWNLYANPAKCEFNRDEVTFLGFVVTTKGIRMDRDKVEAVLDWPAPRSVHDIQMFLGFAGFYRRFIKKYSSITAPLTELVKGKQPDTFDLEPTALEAFEKLKVMFSTAPILKHFDPQLPTRVETDASKWAVGAVLSQLHDSA